MFGLLDIYDNDFFSGEVKPCSFMCCLDIAFQFPTEH